MEKVIPLDCPVCRCSIIIGNFSGTLLLLECTGCGHEWKKDLNSSERERVIELLRKNYSDVLDIEWLIDYIETGNFPSSLAEQYKV